MGVVVKIGSQNPRPVAKKRDKDGPPSGVEMSERVGQRLAVRCPRGDGSRPFGAQDPICIRLERDQGLVWTFDFLFGLEEFFTPRFAGALGALVNRVPNRETVIAGSSGTAAGELLASLAGLEELAFERSVLAPQFVFTDDAHALLILLTTQLLPLGQFWAVWFLPSGWKRPYYV